MNFLELHTTKHNLTEFAMKGEALASSCEHADNIAPCIFGGFSLSVKVTTRSWFLQLPHTFKLVLQQSFIHKLRFKTSEARKLLPIDIPLSKASQQWANLGGLIHAFTH